MRRPLIVLLLLIVGSAAVWTLYHWNRPTTGRSDPWRAVPTQAAVIVQVPDAWETWDRFAHTAQLWGTLEQLPGGAAVGRLLSATVQRMEQDAALRNALQGRAVLHVMLRAGGEHIGHLTIGGLPLENGLPLPALADLLGADAAGAAALARGGTITVKPDSALGELQLAVTDGLWLLASHEEVLEEALLQLRSGHSVTEDPILADALGTLGAGSDAHVLVHTARARRLLHTWWRPDVVDELDLPVGWAALDLRSRPDALLMSGLLLPEEEHALLTAMAAQGTGRHLLGRMLPATVAHLDVQHITAPVMWLEQRRGLSPADQEGAATDLFGWVQGDMALAWAPGDALRPAMRWALFGTADPDDARDALARLCGDTPCDTLRYRDVRLTRMGHAGLLERTLGTAYAPFERPWWTTLGEVVLMSDDPATLRASIDVWNDGRSLAEDARATQWSERMGNEAGRLLWCDVARSRDLLAQGMKPAAAQRITAQGPPWSELGGLTLQLDPGPRGRHHLLLGLQHAPLEMQRTDVLWTTPLDAAVKHRPWIVVNHNTNGREVLLQDERHRLHLLGSNGKLLWTRQLDGAVLGGVQQVDRFRNGKLQLVFNTAEMLYLVDRNGKDVGGFPVALKGGASAPVAVMDYDQERDYRLLVPMQDGRLLNFSGDGLAVKGWEAPRMDAAATAAAEHLRIRNKDYLLVVDGQGRIHLLDRRGAVRANSTLVVDAGARVLHLMAGNELERTVLVWSAPDGALRQGTLAGEITELQPPATGGVGWHPGDDDGPGTSWRIQGDSLLITAGGRTLLQKQWSGNLLPALGPVELGRGERAYAVVVDVPGLLTVVDEAGRELEGLPVPGHTMPAIADLDLDGRNELITVTHDGQVVAYRIPRLAQAQP